jgi:trehalose 6-phosphate phosphatase
LEAAGIRGLFDVKIDGLDAQELGLEGKPSPDIFLMAADRLDVSPDRAVVLEDAISGVEAGKKGRFALVIGVDRTGHGSDLKAMGADVVVTDLSTVQVENSNTVPETLVPSALDRIQEILSKIRNRKVAMFLDYDGTLTPIVDDPNSALLSDSMRETLIELAERLPVAVISGRDLPDVQKLVAVGSLYYAGSHGFDISGPEGMETKHEKGADFLPSLALAERKLKEKLDSTSGAWVERKKFSIAVHYRKVAKSNIDSVKEAVEEVAGLHQDLRMSGGKKIFELQPKIDWHKGKALLWLLRELDLDKENVVPFYIGDDVTDEDAFRVLKDRGIGIVVMDRYRHTEAGYRLNNPAQVERFLKKIISAWKGESR